MPCGPAQAGHSASSRRPRCGSSVRSPCPAISVQDTWSSSTATRRRWRARPRTGPPRCSTSRARSFPRPVRPEDEAIGGSAGHCQHPRARSRSPDCCGQSVDRPALDRLSSHRARSSLAGGAESQVKGRGSRRRRHPALGARGCRPHGGRREPEADPARQRPAVDGRSAALRAFSEEALASAARRPHPDRVHARAAVLDAVTAPLRDHVGDRVRPRKVIAWETIGDVAPKVSPGRGPRLLNALNYGRACRIEAMMVKVRKRSQLDGLGLRSSTRERWTGGGR